MNVVSKQEIHEIIDSLPDYKLEALRPLLLLVSDDYDDTVLTAEEAAEMDQCAEEFRRDPDSFTDFDELKTRYEQEKLLLLEKSTERA
jgi:hypothetical protein